MGPVRCLTDVRKGNRKSSNSFLSNSEWGQKSFRTNFHLYSSGITDSFGKE